MSMEMAMNTSTDVKMDISINRKMKFSRNDIDII